MAYGMVALDLEYEQATGLLYLADPEDARALLCRGYSGRGSGINNPAAEKQRTVGPIPRGVWRLGVALDHPELGPCAIPCQPVGHSAHGRSGFYIHGDNAFGNRSASHGCIVAPREARTAIRALGIRVLVVM